MPDSLTIPTKRYTGEMEPVTVWLPGDLLFELDFVATSRNRTRDDVICKSLVFALDHLTPEENEIPV